MQNDNAIKTSCIDFLRNNSLRKYLKSIKIEKYNIDPPIPVIGWKLKIRPSTKDANINLYLFRQEKSKNGIGKKTEYKVRGIIVHKSEIPSSSPPGGQIIPLIKREKISESAAKNLSRQVCHAESIPRKIRALQRSIGS